MADIEAQINGDHHRPSPVSGFASQARNVIGDMLELAELQAKLAKMDATKASQAALRPAGLLILGICAALASLPVLTLGLATMLSDMTPLKAWHAQLIVGLAVVSIASIVIYISMRRLRSATQQFQRSADELAKNVAWAKIVVRSGRGV